MGVPGTTMMRRGEMIAVVVIIVSVGSRVARRRCAIRRNSLWNSTLTAMSTLLRRMRRRPWGRCLLLRVVLIVLASAAVSVPRFVPVSITRIPHRVDVVIGVIVVEVSAASALSLAGSRVILFVFVVVRSGDSSSLGVGRGRHRTTP